jgi:F0F1-type ATP synthase membrane subunit b/b'
MSSLIVGALNLSFLICILVYKLRGPVAAFVAERAKKIRQNVELAAADLAAARAASDAASAKVKNLASEVDAILHDTRDEGKRIGDAIVSQAERLAVEIVKDARASARESGSELVLALASEAVDVSLKKAEAQVRQRLTGEEKTRLRTEFSKQIGVSG